MKAIKKNLGDVHLVVGAKGSPLQLILSSIYHIDYPTGNIPLDQVNYLKKHPFVEQAIPMSLGDNYKNYRIVGTEHTYADLYSAKLREGALWERNLEVTIGSGVAKKLGLNIGDSFVGSHGMVQEEIEHKHDEHAYKVVGIFEKSSTILDHLILCNTESFWLVHEGHGGSGVSLDVMSNTAKHEHHHHEEKKEDSPEVTSVLLRFKERAIPRAMASLPGTIRKKADLITADPELETHKLLDLVGNALILIQYLAIIIMLISALSVFISLFQSLKERKYEIALIRVMGATKAKVFYVIILEGLIISGIGFALGTLLCHSGIELLSFVLEKNYNYSISGWVFLNEEIILLLISLGIGFIASLIPAIRAYNSEISVILNRD